MNKEPARTATHVAALTRAQTLRRAVIAIVGFMGFPDTKASIAADHKGVAVILPQAEVCAAKPGTAERIAKRVQQTLTALQTVTVQAANGESFAAYRKTKCAPPVLAGGAGHVVYAKNGAGNLTTPEFEISSSHWTVAYRNDGRIFEAFLFDHGALQPIAITTLEKGPGTKVFDGPGRFKLRLVGTSWAVTVRDGS